MPLYPQYKPSILHGTYGVNYYYTDADGSETRLQFETDVRYCGLYKEKYAIYHLTKHEFVVNRNESNLYIYDIAKKCTEAIYPIAILFDKIDKVVYIKPIQTVDKWFKIKSELKRYYKGDMVKNYINRIEDKLISKEIFTLMIESDLFWAQLFALDFVRDYKTKTKVKLPIFPYRYPVDIECEQCIDETSRNDAELNYIKIFHNACSGTLCKYGDIYGKPGMESDKYNTEISVKLNVVYEIDKVKGGIESVEGDYTIFAGDETISSIRLEAYKLNEKQLSFGVDNNFKAMEKEFLRKENSIFNKLKQLFN